MTGFDAEWLVHIATAMLLLAYFIREELWLRLMIIAATMTFNFYYWLVPDPPLWDSVIGGFLMIAVNLFVLAQVMLDRTTFRLSAEEKKLFEGFETLSPGQFRRVLRIAKWREGDGTLLTRQGEPAGSLYYVVEGAVEVEKGEHRFLLPPGNFVGEVAFVLGGGATATTIAPDCTRYVEWDVEELRALGEKYPALGNALNALLTRDLANKLTESYRPEGALPA